MRKLFIAGLGDRGQLGLGQGKLVQTTFAPLPTPFPVSKVFTGSNHTFLLSTSGDLYSFGRGDQGQLGNGTVDDQFSPMKLDSFGKVLSIACGGHHTACIVEHGDKNRLFTWGRNINGQLGLNFKSVDPISIPQEVSFFRDKRIVSVSCGEDFTSVSTSEGDIYVFGKAGQLGVGQSDDTSRPEKLEKYEGEHFILNSGWGHTIGFSNKRVLSWGSNKHGQCGLGMKSEFESVTQMDFKIPLKQISLGSCHSMFLSTKGDVYIFGSCADGKMTSSTSDVVTPTHIALPEPTELISAGTDHLITVSKSAMFGWGFGQHCVLGLEEMVTYNTPQKLHVPAAGKLVDVLSKCYKNIYNVDLQTGAMDSTIVVVE